MTAKGKVLVSIGCIPDVEQSAAASDPELPHLLIAEGVVETAEHSGISVVELRMILPASSADAMVLGMFEGATEIAFTGMAPVVGLK